MFWEAQEDKWINASRVWRVDRNDNKLQFYLSSNEMQEVVYSNNSVALNKLNEFIAATDNQDRLRPIVNALNKMVAQHKKLQRVIVSNALIANDRSFKNIQAYAKNAGISLRQAISETINRTGDES